MLKETPFLAAAPTPFGEDRRNIPALDGVRGIAILVVMLRHFAYGVTAHDWVGRVSLTICGLGVFGVDLFFVLSGFLITRILLRSRLDSHYFRNFYARRTLRIFPLYYAYLVFYFGFVTRFTHIDRARALEASSYQGWIWLYATNILICLRGNYIVASVNHFWTLAVEEHFYLVWPALLRFIDVRRILGLCATAFVIAIGCRAIALRWEDWSPYAGNVFTLCRIDSLAAGAALAVLEQRDSAEVIARRAGRAFWGAVALIAFCGLTFGGLPFGHALSKALNPSLLAILFASVIGLAVWGSSTLLRRILTNRFLCWTGTYAYGLYVLHQPVRILLQRALPSEALGRHLHSYAGGVLLHGALSGAASFVVAFLSYHCFEKHFLSLKRYFVPTARAPEALAEPRLG